jgi:hypothetical protein
VANDFRCKIPHVKAFFAVLTDAKNAALFSTEERELIRRHVPWTRVVQDVKSEYNGKPIELLKYIWKRQKDLVLKPSDEYGGMGVTLGWGTDASRWERAIEEALPGGKKAKAHGCWIVQERKCNTSQRSPSTPIAIRLPIRRSSRTRRPSTLVIGGRAVRSRNGLASRTRSIGRATTRSSNALI